MPELELLDEDELLLDELDELLDDELDDDELDEPPQSAALGLMPVIDRLSMFANPPLVVACRRMVLKPAFRFTVTEPESAQLVHEPVPGMLTLDTVAPLTITEPGRSLEALAKRQLKV